MVLVTDTKLATIVPGTLVAVIDVEGPCVVLELHQIARRAERSVNVALDTCSGTPPAIAQGAKHGALTLTWLCAQSG